MTTRLSLRISFIAVLFVTPLAGAGDISWLEAAPIVSTVKTSQLGQPARTESIVDLYLKKPIKIAGLPMGQQVFEFLGAILARMHRHVDLAAVSEALLDPEYQPAHPGTDIDLLGPFCSRKGDYDFQLLSLARIIDLDNRANPRLLTPAARSRVLSSLLTVRGNKPYVSFRLKLCPPVAIKDSENHRLMTETARLLTNEFILQENPVADRRLFDNDVNGLNKSMSRTLASFLDNDFSELNSRPYQGFSTMALENLATISKNARIKTLAQMVLDYISAKYVVQSKNLKRWGPFRRQTRFIAGPMLQSGDRLLGFAGVLIGQPKNSGRESAFGEPENPIPEFFGLMAGLSDYRIPALILENEFNSSAEYLQIFNHVDPEIYDRAPGYLTTAGGQHRGVFGFGSSENNVQAPATVLITDGPQNRLTSFFRIEGAVKTTHRNNLCVARGFACGLNLRAPLDLPSDCQPEIHGAFRFYNLRDCSLHQKLFVATFTQDLPASSSGPHDENAGFWNVQPSSGFFHDFVQGILKANPSPKISDSGVSRFVSSRGEMIEFNVFARPGQSPLADRQAQGPIRNDRPGHMVIESFSGSGCLELDYADLSSPQRKFNTKCAAN